MTGRIVKTYRGPEEKWNEIKADPMYADVSDNFILDQGVTYVLDHVRGQNRRADSTRRQEEMLANQAEIIKNQRTIIERLDSLERTTDGKTGLATLMLWTLLGVDVAKITAEGMEQYREFERMVLA